MIQCNKCGFAVNDMMKFALMQNSCPSCGANLFSSRDMSLINSIQGKISSERFSSGFTEETLYDVSLYVFNEVKYGLGKSLLDEAVASAKSQPTSEEGVEDGPEMEDVRSQVEEEYAEQIAMLNSDGEVVTDGDGVFTKAERLKRLRQQQLATKPNLGKSLSTAKSDNVLKKGNRVNRVN
jgi:predicted  nucleic acid-binding Zn-ribbon protein